MATTQEIATIKTLAQTNIDKSKVLVAQTDDLTEPYFTGKNTNRDPKSDQVIFARQQSALELQAQANEQSIADIRANVPDGSANFQVLNLQAQNRELAEKIDEVEDARVLAGDETVISQYSTGDVLGEEKDARKEKATVQNPELELDQENVPSNANDFVESDPTPSDDQGAVAGAVAGAEVSVTESDDRTTDVEYGTSANNPEKGVTIPDSFTKPFEAQPNILRELGHYTYQIAIYLQNKEEYYRLVASKQKVPTGDLIIQSGGIAVEERAEEFKDYDYFIDDLEIQSLMPQEVGGATNATSMSFTISEPYGFTFLGNLKKAALRKMDGKGSDFLKQHYLMVVRFFGEDGEGNPTTTFPAAGGGSSTPVALVEKFIPFRFSKITSKARTGIVEYACEALATNHSEGFGQKRAAIPFQVEIKGQTLNDLFNGKDDSQEVAEAIKDTSGRENKTANGEIGSALMTQPKAINTTSKTVISSGLIEALNKRMQKLANEGKVGIADRYKVTFDTASGLSSARIKPPGTTKKSKTPMDNPKQGAQVYLASRGKVDKDTFLISTNAGQQMQQFIDLVTRTSTYITDQQTFHLDPNTGSPTPNEKSNEVMAWFRIGANTKPIEWDDVRNDWAYEIEYVVVPSQVSDLKSEYFPKSKFYGVHKKYSYWFTGTNTEVLSYEVDYNALFYIGMGAEVPKLSTNSADKDDQHAKVVEPPTANSGTLDSKSSEPASRGASVLYSPTDYAQLRMEIYGDPAFIVQNDVFYGLGTYNDRFLPDGTINTDGFETLVEVNWNTIEDYDDTTGTAEIKQLEKKNTKQRDITGTDGIIYALTSITNKFSKGEFTQEINGIMREFQESAVKNTSASSSTTTVTVGRDEAPTQRLPGGVLPGRGTAGNLPLIGPQGGGLGSTVPKKLTVEVLIPGDPGYGVYDEDRGDF